MALGAIAQVAGETKVIIIDRRAAVAKDGPIVLQSRSSVDAVNAAFGS